MPNGNALRKVAKLVDRGDVSSIPKYWNRMTSNSRLKADESGQHYLPFHQVKEKLSSDLKEDPREDWTVSS